MNPSIPIIAASIHYYALSTFCLYIFDGIQIVLGPLRPSQLIKLVLNTIMKCQYHLLFRYSTKHSEKINIEQMRYEYYFCAFDSFISTN